MSGRVTRSRRNADDKLAESAIPTTAGLAVRKSSKRRPQHASETENNESATTRDKNEKCTPPKNGRYSRNPESNYSPSSLMKRLSITTSIGHNDEDVENEVKPIVAPRKKIENARKVLHNAETDELYGREKELDDLATMLETHLNAGTSASLYVSGQPGKTRNNFILCSHRFHSMNAYFSDQEPERLLV